MISNNLKQIAFFISPHGFGHAARETAIMQAINRKQPGPWHFTVFTLVPEWFFIESGIRNLTWIPIKSDIGLIQTDAVTEDLPQTYQAVSTYLDQISQLSDSVQRYLAGSRCVIGDISPLGILAAQKAGLESVMIENFTWDWIYAGYLDLEPRIGALIPSFQELFERANHHIQTEPVSLPNSKALQTAPVSRAFQQEKQEIRDKLGVGIELPLILFTMGGIETTFANVSEFRKFKDVVFVIPGASKDQLRREENLILLPHHSGFYHPDLLRASDGVVGKLGYSTVAEVYAAGVPLAFFPRERFREYAVLRDFVQKEIPSIEIKSTDKNPLDPLKAIDDLLAMRNSAQPKVNGADQIADWLIARFGLT